MQRQHTRYLLERIGAQTPIDQLTARRIAKLLEEERGGRLGRELSGGTLRKRAYTLSQAIELARGRAPQLPEIPYAYRPRTVFLPNFDAYAALRDRLQPRHRLWLAVALWTGQRQSDVERMVKEDFDPRGPFVIVRSTKTRAGRAGVKIHPASELVRELRAHWEMLPAGGKLVPSWPQPNSTLRWHCSKLGLPAITTHSLRHTFFTWYVAANGFTPELLEIGGWSDLRIPALVYAHALPVRFRGQIERTVAMATKLRRAPRKSSSAGFSAKRRGTDAAANSVGPDTRPEGLVHGTGLDPKPPATVKQRRGGVVPRDRVELSTHGFSVCVLPEPTSSSLEAETPSEGLCLYAPTPPT
jgi:integrase